MSFKSLLKSIMSTPGTLWIDEFSSSRGFHSERLRHKHGKLALLRQDLRRAPSALGINGRRSGTGFRNSLAISSIRAACSRYRSPIGPSMFYRRRNIPCSENLLNEEPSREQYAARVSGTVDSIHTSSCSSRRSLHRTEGVPNLSR